MAADGDGGGGAVAESEAGRGVRFFVDAVFSRPASGPAGEVDADVALDGLAGAEREEPVEAGYRVDLGGGGAESRGEVIDRWRADPADPVIEGVETRQRSRCRCPRTT